MIAQHLQERTRRTRRRTRALVALAAILSAVIVWVIAIPVLGIDVRVPDNPGSATRVDLEFLLVAMTATVAVLAGWGLLAVLERFTRRARTIWTAVAVLVFVLTLPYLPGFTIVERAVLALMHLALAAVLILGLRRTSEPVR